MLTLIFYTALSSMAFGLTLQEAQNISAAHSPELIRASSAKEEADWRLVEARGGYMPSISARATHLLDKKYMFIDLNFQGNALSLPNIIPSTMYSVGGEWNLFDGFATTDRYRAALRGREAAHRELSWSQFKNKLNIALQYYRALSSELLKNVAENNVKVLKDHQHDVELLRKSGVATRYDGLRVDVQVSEAESELLNATDNIEVSRGHLAEVLGVDTVEAPAGKLPELTTSVIQKIDFEHSLNRQDIQAMSLRAEALDLEDSADSRHWVPRLSIAGSYDYYNNRTDNYDTWNDFRNAYQVGLSLTWNLFDGFKSTAKSHETTEQKIQLQTQLRKETLKAKQDLDLWRRKYGYYCLVYKARQGDVIKSRESVRLAREGRRVGARTTTDLLDAEAELYRAEAGAVTAQMGAIEALIQLELSSDLDLYTFN